MPGIAARSSSIFPILRQILDLQQSAQIYTENPNDIQERPSNPSTSSSINLTSQRAIRPTASSGTNSDIEIRSTINVAPGPMSSEGTRSSYSEGSSVDSSDSESSVEHHAINQHNLHIRSLVEFLLTNSQNGLPESIAKASTNDILLDALHIVLNENGDLKQEYFEQSADAQHPIASSVMDVMYSSSVDRAPNDTIFGITRHFENYQ